ncbi:MAG: SdpI family protein [Oscillospiraceae bacterium]|jgi:uncharacterized membrane protein|nr:SdpI family protein [Oscillospiraceae bacterium]
MKNLGKTKAITWILAFTPLILTLFFYGRLPEQIPTNWGISGSVEAYGPKSTLFIIAGLSPVMALTKSVLPAIDPRRRNYKKFRGFYEGFYLVMMLFLLGLNCMVISESLNPGRLSVSSLVAGGCGLVFAFLGNMMPKVKSNFFVGVRTPWALSDTEVWNKTQRLGGQLFFFGGILLVICAALLEGGALFAVTMAVAFLAALVPAAMSFFWYRSRGEKNPSADE